MNRVAIALPMAASSLRMSNTYLGGLRFPARSHALDAASRAFRQKDRGKRIPASDGKAQKLLASTPVGANFVGVLLSPIKDLNRHFLDAVFPRYVMHLSAAENPAEFNLWT